MIKDKVFWYETKSASCAALNSDCTADVVIVGGGMAGLMCAHALVQEGKSVVIVEKDFCGAGGQWKKLRLYSPDSELELSDLISNYMRPISLS